MACGTIILERDLKNHNSNTKRHSLQMEEEEQKINPRKRKCEICNDVESKYRCPGCNMQTCSLPCVKEHKIKKNCDGRRCATEFVRVKDFTDAHMLSDYRFLEELSRCSSNASRDKRNRMKSQNNRRLNLVRQARQRGTDLKLIAIGMSKQRENTSLYNNKEKCFYWRVKFQFVNEDAEYFLPNVKETDILSDVVKSYVEPEDDDYIAKYKLKSYINAGIDKVNVYMKKERSKISSYYKLDFAKTIKDNLRHKTVIEYPIFYVAIDGKDDEFQTHACENNAI